MIKKYTFDQKWGIIIYSFRCGIRAIDDFVATNGPIGNNRDGHGKIASSRTALIGPL